MSAMMSGPPAKPSFNVTPPGMGNGANIPSSKPERQPQAEGEQVDLADGAIGIAKETR